MRKILLLCVVVCSMLAFAAEPSTSTELDRHEGRAHWGVVSHASPVIDAASTATGSTAAPLTLAALAALLAVLFGSRATRVDVELTGASASVLRRARLARRGPPARV